MPWVPHPERNRAKRDARRVGSHRLVRLIAISFATFLAGCGSALAPQPATASAASAQSPAARFDAAWQTADQQYPYFTYKRIDWEAARADYRARAEQALTDAELAGIVRDLFATLHDEHVILRNTATGREWRTYEPQRVMNWDRGVWKDYVTRGNWQQGQSNWGTATFGSAAYIAIGEWDPEQVRIADLDAALERFRNAPLLILDVRMNPGGDDRLAFQFAGRFATTQRVADFVQYRNGPLHTDFTAMRARVVVPRGAWQFTHPVLLLVGRGCTSSSESFIAAMRELPNVIVVGDTTGGSSGNPAFYDLGGGWQYSLSRWIEYTAEGDVIEQNGIRPGIFIPATAADFQRGRDPILDWAIAQAP